MGPSTTFGNNPRKLEFVEAILPFLPALGSMAGGLLGGGDSGGGMGVMDMRNPQGQQADMDTLSLYRNMLGAGMRGQFSPALQRAADAAAARYEGMFDDAPDWQGVPTSAHRQAANEVYDPMLERELERYATAAGAGGMRSGVHQRAAMRDVAAPLAGEKARYALGLGDRELGRWGSMLGNYMQGAISPIQAIEQGAQNRERMQLAALAGVSRDGMQGYQEPVEKGMGAPFGGLLGNLAMDWASGQINGKDKKKDTSGGGGGIDISLDGGGGTPTPGSLEAEWAKLKPKSPTYGRAGGGW